MLTACPYTEVTFSSHLTMPSITLIATPQMMRNTSQHFHIGRPSVFFKAMDIHGVGFPDQNLSIGAEHDTY